MLIDLKWKPVKPKGSNGWWQIVLKKNASYDIASVYGFDAAEKAAIIAQTPNMYKFICRLYKSGKMPDKFKEEAEKLFDTVDSIRGNVNRGAE